MLLLLSYISRFCFLQRSQRDLWGNDPIIGLVMSVCSVLPHAISLGVPRSLSKDITEKSAVVTGVLTQEGQSFFLPFKSLDIRFLGINSPDSHTPLTDAADLGSDSTIP